jgi:hypothetical protein
MGQFSVEKPVAPGSVLSGNQQPPFTNGRRFARLRPASHFWGNVEVFGHFTGPSHEPHVRSRWLRGCFTKSSAFQRAKPPSYDVEKTRFRAAVVKGLKWPRSQVLLSYFTDTREWTHCI